jgi:hypothetical protein
MPDLWRTDSPAEWQRALARYDEVLRRQQVDGLEELDCWVRTELPRAIAAREAPHVTRDELVRVTQWKMARGVWRARNLALVRGNAADEVVEVSREALAGIPDPRAPIAGLTRLAGVGPATASAIVSAAAPDVYPFFDDLVATQVPNLGKVAFTLGFYVRYAEALRGRARSLGGDWSPALVERALWAYSGGKAAAR